MKLSALPLAIVLPALLLGGCIDEFPTDDDEEEIVYMDLAPPDCSALVMVSSAILSTRGGWVTLSVRVDNSYGCDYAYDVLCDISIEDDLGTHGGSSVDLGTIDGGLSSSTTITIATTGPQRSDVHIHYWVSWFDWDGNYYEKETTMGPIFSSMTAAESANDAKAEF